MNRLTYAVVYFCAIFSILSSKSPSERSIQLSSQEQLAALLGEEKERYDATALQEDNKISPEQLKICRDKQSSLSFLRRLLPFATSPATKKEMAQAIRKLEEETKNCPALPLEIPEVAL